MDDQSIPNQVSVECSSSSRGGLDEVGMSMRAEDEGHCTTGEVSIIVQKVSLIAQLI